MNYTHAVLHDDDLEQAILGTMLVDEHGLRTGLSLLRDGAAVFYQPASRALYAAMQKLSGAGKAVSPTAVIRQLTADGTLSKVGTGADVMGLQGKGQPAGKMETHCRFLIELHVKRRVGEIARAMVDASGDPTQDCFALLGKATNEIGTLYNGLQINRPMKLAELYHGVVDSIVKAASQPGGITGVPSGMSSLDRVTGGWQPSDLIIIAARPAMGKTTLAVFMARCAAGDVKWPGVIFTLEMSNEQLVRKMIATEAGYTTSQLQKGALDGGVEEAEAIRERAKALLNVGITLDDTPGLSIGELAAKVARLVAEEGIKFVVVDYLQLLTNPGSNRNREQEISSISRTLKIVAKTHNIPVIALAQLSRESEKRGGDKKPMLSDLRESGAIEQDADVIIFPYRPEYYGITEDEMGNPTAGTTEVIIAKHRNGALANVIVSSDMGRGRYSDLDTSVPNLPPAPGPLRTATASDFEDQPWQS